MPRRSPAIISLRLFCLLIGASAVQQSFALQADAVFQTVSQTVSVGVAPISVIAVSGDPQPFLFNGDQSFRGRIIQDHSTFYSLTTNVEHVNLSAEIDAPMPNGAHLLLEAGSSLGHGQGPIEISDAVLAQTLVEAIGRGLENNAELAYHVRLDESLERLETQSRTVTVMLCPTDESGMDVRTESCSSATQSIIFGLE